jgi:hypothetical protein
LVRKPEFAPFAPLRREEFGLAENIQDQYGFLVLPVDPLDCHPALIAEKSNIAANAFSVPQVSLNRDLFCIQTYRKYPAGSFLAGHFLF